MDSQHKKANNTIKKEDECEGLARIFIDNKANNTIKNLIFILPI
jgi:hypothetical protein